MATLTFWKFDSPDAADRASETLHELAKQNHFTLHGAASVSWPRDRKKPTTRQLSDTTTAGALGGSFWGLLFGLTFLMPLLCAALGAAPGPLAGSLADVGIDDSFINKTRDHVTLGTSALFLMSSDAVMDQVQDAFAGHQPSELLCANLSTEQENALREVFGD